MNNRNQVSRTNKVNKIIKELRRQIVNLKHSLDKLHNINNNVNITDYDDNTNDNSNNDGDKNETITSDIEKLNYDINIIEKLSEQTDEDIKYEKARITNINSSISNLYQQIIRFPKL